MPRMPKLRQVVWCSVPINGGCVLRRRDGEHENRKLRPLCQARKVMLGNETSEAASARWRTWDAEPFMRTGLARVCCTRQCLAFGVFLPEDCGQVTEEQAALHRQPRVEDDRRKQVAAGCGRAVLGRAVRSEYGSVTGPSQQDCPILGHR